MPAIEIENSLRNQDVILSLSRLMRLYGNPAFIRSDNGAEFTTTAVMKELRECLNREWLIIRRETKILIEKWRQFYNNERRLVIEPRLKQVGNGCQLQYLNPKAHF